MGSVSFTQGVSIKSGRLPTNGTQIIQKDFEIYPAQTIVVTDWNENLTHRFSIPVGAMNLSLCIGTLNVINVLIVNPDADITLQLTNTNGTTQDMVFAGGRISILHVELTGLSASNPTAVPITGVFYVAGN